MACVVKVNSWILFNYIDAIALEPFTGENFKPFIPLAVDYV
jgi:hypothetical protein